MGRNVKIWHFAYVGDNVEIGDDVVIGSLAHVDRDVKIGSGTRIQGLVYIPPLTVIGRNVFIGPAAVFTNDPYPPSRRMIGVTVEDEAVIGARSVVLAGVTVGRRSVVAMGSVVVRDVPPETVVAGVPARILYSREEYDRKRAAWESGGSAPPRP
ncbi:MAG: acyltransferase [Conexivisphaera sp.]